MKCDGENNVCKVITKAGITFKGTACRRKPTEKRTIATIPFNFCSEHKKETDDFFEMVEKTPKWK